jgi:hypothetical protein
MMHPVGSKPPAVYWRRRVVLMIAVVLVVISIYVFLARGSSRPGASALPPAGTPSTSAANHPARTSAPATPRPSTTSGSTGCPGGTLKLAAATAAPSFKLGSQPGLALQVTNTGSKSCVADLSDTQIELLVYNGESRVWGSHDCQIAPGTQLMTLNPRQAVRRSITWTGLSSQPHCAGTRQLVGAGTYTLHAKLSGVEGAPATFSLT